MKKKILLHVLISLSTVFIYSTSCAENIQNSSNIKIQEPVSSFSGLNSGIFVGDSSPIYYHTVSNAEGVTVMQHNHGNNGWAGAVDTSYLFPLSAHVLLGPEAHVQYNTAIRAAIDSTTTLTKNDAHWNYGFAAKLGYALSTDSMVYALAGPEFTEIKSVYQDTSPFAIGSSSDSTVGLMLGFGAEQVLTQHLHLCEQMNYGWLGTGTTYMSNKKTIDDQLRLVTEFVALVYHF